MRLPTSLRAKLTVAFTGIAGVAILAAALGMTWLIEHATWAPLDAALDEEAETLMTIRDSEPTGDLQRAVFNVGAEAALGPAKFIRVVGPDGAVLAQSGAAPDAAEPGTWTAEMQDGSSAAHTIMRHGEGGFRVVRFAGERGTVEIGVNAARRLRALRQGYLAIWVSAAGLLATLAALTWAITTRATGELTAVAAELETIEGGSLDRRLAARRTTEVDHLTTVLNRLLARLEGTMQHLRRFTADAAHELRTPIAALRAHLEVALARSRSPEAYRNGLLDALEQTERLGGLAEALLMLSAVESDTTDLSATGERVRVDELVREVGQSLEPVAQEQGRDFAWSAEIATVRGAPTLLRRLVLNLVDNAFRHTPSGAAVRLSARVADGHSTILVEDGGPGIAPDDLPLVFDRFHRGSTTANGTGIGLALCREIVGRHRGKISVTSVPSGGTTVTVTLPIAADPDPAPAGAV